MVILSKTSSMEEIMVHVGNPRFTNKTCQRYRCRHIYDVIEKKRHHSDISDSKTLKYSKILKYTFWINMTIFRL